MTTGDRTYDANASVIETQVIDLQNGTPTAAQTAVAALATVTVGSGGDYATWAAYRAAIGAAPVLGAQTVTVLSDLAASDPVSFPGVGPAGAWTLAGQTSVIHAGTLTAGTAAYTAGPPATSAIAEDTALPVGWAASGLEGELVKNTTLTEYTFVLKSLAAKQARIGRSASGWAAGNAYQVLARPTINAFAPGAMDVAPGGSIVVRDLKIEGGGNVSQVNYGGNGLGSPVVFERVSLGSVIGTFRANSCAWTAPAFAYGSDVYGLRCCLMPDGAGGVVQITGGQLVLIEGQMEGSSVVQNIGFALLDLTSFNPLVGYPAVWLLGGGMAALGLAGTGGNVEGVIVGNGLTLSYYATPSVTGTGGELTLGVTAYTWAALAASATGLTDANWARAIPA